MLKVNVEEYARRLTRPFLMASLASIDNYLISAYSCLGAMAWHRHLDEDELFIGYSGTGSIESTWGAVALGFCELVVVPKGLAHRSVAAAPAILLLGQTRGMHHRRNGHQRLFAGDGGQLRKVSIAQEAARLTDVFVPRRVAMSDALGISVQICLGAQQWHHHVGGQLVFCQYGQFVVEGETGREEVARGELVVVNAGERHRVVAIEPATAMVMARTE